MGIMFGHGNGSFGDIMKFYTAATRTYSAIVVVDFNDDSHLDIVFYRYDPESVDILLGDGKGQRQTLFSVEICYDVAPLLVGDFNGDGDQDIISIVLDPPSFNVLLNTSGCCTAQ
ncbi:unnamed protein product [Didymodactylos carnosus]|uniref:VCBS repeat-containing protein n=2 Tax=Didymodactylos carnosus TaxID=1234261 RepID=A0A815WXL1_9BILA|nr:unnamed protein product [Didymodactylos carnosus]CAF4409946.1 unnamed protein product [Didymodactylos carnosus]